MSDFLQAPDRLIDHNELPDDEQDPKYLGWYLQAGARQREPKQWADAFLNLDTQTDLTIFEKVASRIEDKRVIHLTRNESQSESWRSARSRACVGTSIGLILPALAMRFMTPAKDLMDQEGVRESLVRSLQDARNNLAKFQKTRPFLQYQSQANSEKTLKDHAGSIDAMMTALESDALDQSTAEQLEKSRTTKTDPLQRDAFRSLSRFMSNLLGNQMIREATDLGNLAFRTTYSVEQVRDWCRTALE